MFQGLPLHPLMVHFGVVLGLLGSGALLVAALLPRFRAWLSWGLPVLGVVAGVALRVTQSFGEMLQESSAGYDSAAVHRHAEWGEQAGTAGLVLILVSLLVWLTLQRGRGPAWLGTLARVAAVLVPLWAIVAITLAGHTGAQSVWLN